MEVNRGADKMVSVKLEIKGVKSMLSAHMSHKQGVKWKRKNIWSDPRKLILFIWI